MYAKQTTVKIGGTTSDPFIIYDSHHYGSAPTTMGQLAVWLGKIRQQGAAFGRVSVHVVGRKLQVRTGPDDTLHFGLTGASDLGLEDIAHPGAYPLVGGADGTRTRSLLCRI